MHHTSYHLEAIHVSTPDIIIDSATEDIHGLPHHRRGQCQSPALFLPFLLRCNDRQLPSIAKTSRQAVGGSPPSSSRPSGPCSFICFVSTTATSLLVDIIITFIIEILSFLILMSTVSSHPMMMLT